MILPPDENRAPPFMHTLAIGILNEQGLIGRQGNPKQPNRPGIPTSSQQREKPKRFDS